MTEQSPDHHDPPGTSADSLTPTFAVSGVPVEMVKVMRVVVPQVVERITLQVQLELAGYAGRAGGNRHHLIHDAVEKAVSHFLDVAENRPSVDNSVFDLIRQLGQLAAIEGNSLDALRAAHHVATRIAWEEIRDLSKEASADAAVLGTLLDALLLYIEQLMEQIALGHNAAASDVESSTYRGRRLLLTAILSGQPPERYTRYLEAAEWEPPENVVVITGLLDPAVEQTNPLSFSPEVLSGIIRHRVTLIVRPGLVHRLSHRLLSTPGIESVAASWVVHSTEIRDAYRWTCRALDLADTGIIDDPGVIECAKHRSTLLLHADPALSRLAGEELLAPLLTQTPHNQLVLAETLLLWLQTRASAPALAKRLDVHPNTARSRMRNLKGLFGGLLTDPQQTLALLSALEVAVPLWREQAQPDRLRRPRP